eukprot:UN27456
MLLNVNYLNKQRSILKEFLQRQNDYAANIKLKPLILSHNDKNNSNKNNNSNIISNVSCSGELSTEQYISPPGYPPSSTEVEDYCRRGSDAALGDIPFDHSVKLHLPLPPCWELFYTQQNNRQIKTQTTTTIRTTPYKKTIKTTKDIRENHIIPAKNILESNHSNQVNYSRQFDGFNPVLDITKVDTFLDRQIEDDDITNFSRMAARSKLKPHDALDILKVNP